MPRDITQEVDLSLFPMQVLYDVEERTGPEVVANRVVDVTDLFPSQRLAQLQVSATLMRYGQTATGPLVELIENHVTNDVTEAVGPGVHVAVSQGNIITRYRLHNHLSDTSWLQDNPDANSLAANELLNDRVKRMGGITVEVAAAAFAYLPDDEDPLLVLFD